MCVCVCVCVCVSALKHIFVIVCLLSWVNEVLCDKQITLISSPPIYLLSVFVWVSRPW